MTEARNSVLRNEAGVRQIEGSIADASLMPVGKEAQDSFGGATGLWNAEGLKTRKFPEPSFRSTATGWFVHCVLTTTSRNPSLLMSREDICSPPQGAKTSRLRRNPPLR